MEKKTPLDIAVDTDQKETVLLISAHTVFIEKFSSASENHFWVNMS
jgi:hypothetical protein